MISIIKEAALSLRLELNPEIVMTDFETAAMNAYQFHFPRVQLIGCFFHYGQAIYRRLKNECKLSSEYRTDNDLAKWLKSVIALALLPPSQVETAFAYLMEEEVVTKYPALTEFNDYFVETWI